MSLDGPIWNSLAYVAWGAICILSFVGGAATPIEVYLGDSSIPTVSLWLALAGGSLLGIVAGWSNYLFRRLMGRVLGTAPAGDHGDSSALSHFVGSILVALGSGLWVNCSSGSCDAPGIWAIPLSVGIGLMISMHMLAKLLDSKR